MESLEQCLMPTLAVVTIILLLVQTHIEIESSVRGGIMPAYLSTESQAPSTVPGTESFSQQ